MAKIKYIEFDGKEHEIEVSNGLTVMEGAITVSYTHLTLPTTPYV